MKLLRLALLAPSFVALQLSLTGRIPCGEVADRNAGNAAAAMAGMPMPSTAVPGKSAPAPSPCQQTGMPGACPWTAACAAALMTVRPERPLVRALPSVSFALTLLGPDSPALPPELPPPRA